MEICVDSIESALNAVEGGAHRLELCSALNEGGLTPSIGILKTLKTIIPIPIFVMLRSRCGNDFQVSMFDIKSLIIDLHELKNSGADGFVFGALNANGEIDSNACATIISNAHPLPVTFHRAFDVAKTDPIEMAQKIADLGFKRLLTSGRKTVASDGKFLIKSLIETMKDRLIIIPGGGIQVKNLKDILITTLAHEFHGSAKVLKQYTDTNNVQLNPDDKAGLQYVTSIEVVRQLLNIYENHFNQD